MKTRFLRYTLAAAILFCNHQFLSAQCGPNNVNPEPQAVGLCDGDLDTVDFDVTGNCTGFYQYQVVNSSSAIIQPWSTLDQFYINSSTTPDTYTVQVRCSSCPTTVVTDTFLVEIISQPTIVADTFVCYGTAANFSASGGAPGSMSWWDTPGGTQLSPNENYTSAPMTSDDTVYVQVTATTVGSGTQGSILITECGLEGFAGGTGSEDYIEISNLFSNTVNTAGWIVALSDSYGNINSVNNQAIWNLPGSFQPCSILSRTDVNGQSNYIGDNILWNPNQPGWAIILDDVGNVVDFACWGWTAAQIASFNTTINGFNVTLGPEWSGNSISSSCNTVAGTPYSLSRIGNSDSNTAADFVCQATSLNVVNPSLNCGWTTANVTCPYPVAVEVDMPPTASNPADTTVACSADVPAADVTVVTDELDDHTAAPTVQYMGEVSDGLTCPETITRTYRVLDSCSNFIEVTHTIIVNDTIDPTLDPAPADLTVSCISEVPAIPSLNWTDNCDGSGSVNGVEVSDGQTCPETITRTWTYTDGCGNTATTSQTIIVNDLIPPTASNPPTVQIPILPPADISVVADAADNCGTPVVAWVEDSTDNGFCPETVIRTYSVTDDCGNVSYVTQTFLVGDVIPDASFIASPTTLSNLESGVVEFTNTTSDAVSYIWDFGDNSPNSNEINPTHEFDNSESAGYYVTLWGISEYGCVDSFSVVINVQEVLLYYVPNAFTPDGDEYNQTFAPVFESGFDVHDYHFTIFNRWGEVIFESFDHTVGWDGTYGGEIVQQGTYTYKIEFGLEYTDARKIVTGHFSLIK